MAVKGCCNLGIMAAIFHVNSPGYGNLFTSPDTTSAHNAFVIIPFQEWVGVIDRIYMPSTICKRVFYAVLITIVLKLAVTFP